MSVPLTSKKVSNVPAGLHCSAACFDGKSSVYLFGGRTNHFDEVNQMFQYDINKDEWTTLTLSEPIPKPRCGHAMIVKENKIYMFGGMMDGDYENFFWVFDVDKKEWSKKDCKDLPQLNCFVYFYDELKDKIIIHGGMQEDGYTNADIYEYSFETNSWSKFDVGLIWEDDGFFKYVSNGPFQRMEHAGCKINSNRFIINGGWSFKHQSNNDTWIFDYKTKTWNEIPSEGPQSHLGHVGFLVYNDWFIVCGGNSKSNEVFALNVEDCEWQDISKKVKVDIGTHPFIAPFIKDGKECCLVGGGTLKKKLEGNCYTSEPTTNAYVFECTKLKKKRTEKESDNEEEEEEEENEEEENKETEKKKSKN
ncbi:hypothetical protein ABK040_004889 [Willaertia magna]